MDEIRLQAGAECLLLAPRAGRVASIQVRPGVSLVPAQHLMDIFSVGEPMQSGVKAVFGPGTKIPVAAREVLGYLMHGL